MRMNILVVAQLSALLVMAAERAYFKWMLAAAITLGGLQLALLVTERFRALRRSTAITPTREAAIDELYAELRRLMDRRESGLEGEISRRLDRLRELQQEEAEAMRQRFETRLHLEPGAGWRALQEARRLLAEDENPTPTNRAAARQA